MIRTCQKAIWPMLLAAALLVPSAAMAQTAGTTARELLLGPEIALQTEISTQGRWALRLGLIAGWAMTGALLGLTDDGRFPPYPVAALGGWLAFEWASASSTIPTDPDGWAVKVLSANFGLMATFMMVASMKGPCNPLESGGLACFQRSDQEWSLAFRSGAARLASRPLDLLIDAIWKRTQGETPRRWKILFAPVYHQGSVTGAGIGLQLSL